MTDFLLHQNGAGLPVGIFTETGSYYPPENDRYRLYGEAVVDARGSQTEWADWIDQVASKFPTPTAQWDVYPHDDAPLAEVLDDAIADTSDQ